MQISFRRFGNKGKNIVFLHGWQQDGKSFSPLIPFLHKYYRLYLPDLPGFGKTPLPPEAFSSQDYANSVINWLDEIGLDKTIIVGHSFGGKVASLLARQKPRRVIKLVLIATAGIPERHWWYSLTDRIPARMKSVFQLLPLEGFYSRDYNNAGPLLPTFKKIVKEDLRSTFAEISQSSLVIWGEEDKELPLENGREIATLLPKGKLTVVSGGHFPFWDNPEEVAELIRQFITRK